MPEARRIGGCHGACGADGEPHARLWGAAAATPLESHRRRATGSGSHRRRTAGDLPPDSDLGLVVGHATGGHHRLRSIGRQMLGIVVWLNRMTWQTVALFIDVRDLVCLNRMTVLDQSFLLSIRSSELVIYEIYILMNKNK